MYNTVIHDKLPLSRFDSAGFRCSFKLVSEGKFVLAKRKHATKIARLICDESRAAVVNEFAFTTAGPSGTHSVSPIALFANHAANDSISADTPNCGAGDAGSTAIVTAAAILALPGRRRRGPPPPPPPPP